ncbi:MAG TPA: 4-hydroxythreonine-4-phosphate dehydrogenase PdxA [Xanthobacteraceae bacterium]|nr:4-hydroxythreonine-4-phosphate dehydrogenase PdxA [Xanthobacteraceae bacterium]
MPQQRLPRIAIATGDPAGIGPEVSLKAALDPAVAAVCRPLLVGDPAVIEKHAAAAGLSPPIRVIADIEDAAWPEGSLELLAVPFPESARLTFGVNDATYGRATLASAARAIAAARAGAVDAVVGAPHNQTSIAAARIPFDGYPGFVARETGMDPHDVFMMLWFGDIRIVHCTLHVGVAEALRLLTRERVGRAIRAADAALRHIGILEPRLCVGGLNPHAGEGGLFGREEIEVIAPAIAEAQADGLVVEGPFGADTMLARRDVDAFLVMLHDQGHIPAKLLAPNQSAAFAIGSPVLFSSVAHGSAFDIAGKGIASPAAMIEAIARLAGARPNGAARAVDAAVHDAPQASVEKL